MTVSFFNGYVVDTPISGAESIRVSVPNLTQMDRKTFGPLPFKPQVNDTGGVILPTRGDKAIVGVDDTAEGDQWIVGWTGTRVVFTIGAGAGVALDSWHIVGNPGEPAFQNSWAVTNSAPVAFRKDTEGRVHIRGECVGGATNTVIFTLPIGYRPTFGHYHIALGPGGLAGNYIRINTDGTVVGTWANAAIHLGDIEFDTGTVQSAQSSIAQPLDSWHVVGSAGEPAFNSGWSSLVDGTGPVGFRKYQDGRVLLRGMALGPNAGGTIFTLPAGYRPARNYSRFWTEIEAASGTALSGGARIWMTAAGDVIADNAPATGVRWSLDGIEFDTETITAYAVGSLPGGKFYREIQDLNLTVAGSLADLDLGAIQGNVINGIEVTGMVNVTTTTNVLIYARLNNANITGNMVVHRAFDSVGTYQHDFSGLVGTGEAVTLSGPVLASSDFNQSSDVFFSAKIFTRTASNRHWLTHYGNQSAVNAQNRINATLVGDWNDAVTVINQIGLRFQGAAAGFTAGTIRGLIVKSF